MFNSVEDLSQDSNSAVTCVTLVLSKQSMQLVLTTPVCSLTFSPFSFNRKNLQNETRNEVTQSLS